MLITFQIKFRADTDNLFRRSYAIPLESDAIELNMNQKQGKLTKSRCQIMQIKEISFLFLFFLPPGTFFILSIFKLLLMSFGRAIFFFSLHYNAQLGLKASG
jgi:hypothetical protein